jgi:hypothetical protein
MISSLFPRGNRSNAPARGVHPIGEAELQAALRSLADEELLYVRGVAPDATYQFKHALICDAAYEALLKSRRKDLHLMVSRTIENKFPALKEAHPETPRTPLDRSRRNRIGDRRMVQVRPGCRVPQRVS